MKKLLITGASGFVGSHLSERAKAIGYDVFTLVRSSSDTTFLKQLDVHILKADITDPEALETVFRRLKETDIQLEAVIHAAALTKAPNWDQFEWVNCKGTENLINILKHFQPDLERFIFISSLAASGPTITNQIIQLEDEAPITNYGRSKLLAEKLVKNSSFPFVIFRPTAVYGPREKDLLTVFRLINKGWNLSIGKHAQQLTFVYVKDLVELILQSVTSASNQTFFVSDGEVYSKDSFAKHIYLSLNKNPISIAIPLWLVKQLARISEGLAKLQTKTSPLNLEKYQELKAESWACNVKPTFSFFKFEPKYDLKKGVEETTQWYQQQGWI